MRPGLLSCAKVCRWFLLYMILGCSLAVCSSGTAHAREATFALQSARGRVEIQVGGKGSWKAIGRGVRDASPGDHIRTGPKGSVHIVTDDGARISLGPKTEIVLQDP